MDTKEEETGMWKSETKHKSALLSLLVPTIVNEQREMHRKLVMELANTNGEVAFRKELKKARIDWREEGQCYISYF